MPGLEFKENVPATESSGAVALSIPAASGLATESTLPPVQPPQSLVEEAGDDEGACQWPVSLMRREDFKKGEYLFKIGDRAEKLFYIRKGMVRLPEINRFIRAGQVI